MTPDELKARRKALRYTQAELAELTGYNIRTINRMEAGAYEIPKILELAMKSLEPKKAVDTNP